ncbi:MAG: helix-turn-helix domain-containing protein [Bacillota bacterium]
MSVATLQPRPLTPGEMFRRARLKVGVLRKQLAPILHCSIQAIEAYENGRRPAPQGAIEWMAEKNPAFGRRHLARLGFEAVAVLDGPKVDKNPVTMIHVGMREMREMMAAADSLDLVNKPAASDLTEHDQAALAEAIDELLDIETWAANTFDELCKRYGVDRKAALATHREKLDSRGYTEEAVPRAAR